MEYLQGRIDSVEKKKAKDGAPYLSLKIDGQHYTCWDEELFSGLKEGNLVQYRWRPSGRFKRITELKVIQDSPKPGANEQSLMRKMSALRSAALLHAHDNRHPYQKRLNTLLTALSFELYLLNEELPGAFYEQLKKALSDEKKSSSFPYTEPPDLEQELEIILSSLAKG